jgi:PAS domain S-box-containing protein
MAQGYLMARAFAATTLAVCTTLLAVLWAWHGGWIIAGASVVVVADAALRLLRKASDRVMLPLMLDLTVAGTAVLVTDVPDMVIVAPLFFDLVSAVFALSRRDSLFVVVYSAMWTLAVVRFDSVVAGTGLTGAQQDVVAAIAIVTYLASTYLMTTTAAIAVREQQKLNDELREQESHLKAVVDSTPIVLYAIDGNGVFTLSEGPGLRLLGLEPREVVGLGFADVYADNPEVLEMVNTALASDVETVHEVTLGEVSFAVRHRPRRDAAGRRQGTVGVAIDVTAEATYRRELENQIRSRDEFVASVSHELRTPLSVVYGLGEELHTNSADLSPDAVEELHALLAQQAGEVVAIVEDLLVAARGDIDRLVVVADTVDISTQITSVLQPLALEHPVDVVAPAEPVLAVCDGARSRQILRNLVMNAARHGGQHIELDYGHVDDHVFIEVRDDGDGVPSGEESRIFDAYHRSDATTGNPASIGLGLTVAKKLAQLMDGDLNYARRDGWSVFRLSLPAAHATQPVSRTISGNGQPSRSTNRL